MPFQILVNVSDLDQVLVISTNEPAKIDINAILRTIPNPSSNQKGSASLPSPKPSFENQPNPFLRSTKRPTKVFIFDEANPEKEMPSEKPKLPLNSSQSNSNVRNPLIGANGGPFLVVDPQVDFDFFNTNSDVQSSTEPPKAIELRPEVSHTPKTTEKPVVFLLSRDVFIPEQVDSADSVKTTKPKPIELDIVQSSEQPFDLLSSKNVFIPKQLDTKVSKENPPQENNAATIEYDLGSYDLYSDYAFNEMDFDDMNFDNEIDHFEYQDELDMPTLDSTLLSVEESAPQKLFPQNIPKSRLAKPDSPQPAFLPGEFQEISTINGRMKSHNIL